MDFSVGFDTFTLKIKNHVVSLPTQGANDRHLGFIIRNSACTVSISGVLVSFSRIRVDARKRNESGYVWTHKLLNPQQNVCGHKQIRIRVDGVSLFLLSLNVEIFA